MNTDKKYLQHVSDLLQASLKVLTALHQVFDVVDVREVDLEKLEELCLAVGKIDVGEDAEQIPEVVAAVEREPLHVVKQNNS